MLVWGSGRVRSHVISEPKEAMRGSTLGAGWGGDWGPSVWGARFQKGWWSEVGVLQRGAVRLTAGAWEGEGEPVDVTAGAQ